MTTSRVEVAVGATLAGTVAWRARDMNRPTRIRPEGLLVHVEWSRMLARGLVSDEESR